MTKESPEMDAAGRLAQSLSQHQSGNNCGAKPQEFTDRHCRRGR
jgi:hypothetical protein